MSNEKAPHLLVYCPESSRRYFGRLFADSFVALPRKTPGIPASHSCVARLTDDENPSRINAPNFPDSTLVDTELNELVNGANPIVSGRVSDQLAFTDLNSPIAGGPSAAFLAFELIHIQDILEISLYEIALRVRDVIPLKTTPPPRTSNPLSRWSFSQATPYWLRQRSRFMSQTISP